MENFQDCRTNKNNSPQNSIHVTDTVIQNVTANRGTSFVTIGYDDCSACRQQAQVTLIVNKTTEIRNEQGEDIPVTALQAGMVVECDDKKYTAADTGIPDMRKGYAAGLRVYLRMYS